jgi:hypothetical protein
LVCEAQDVLHSTSAITVFYIYSEAGAGKVKRIRNNPNVRSAMMLRSNSASSRNTTAGLTRVVESARVVGCARFGSLGQG